MKDQTRRMVWVVLLLRKRKGYSGKWKSRRRVCSGTKMVRSDDIKRLLEVKDFNRSRSRRDSIGSDTSDRSDLSTKSMPQYSSYRTLSGGLLGPFENPPARPGSRTGFLPWNSGKSSMSKVRTPASKGKESMARPRGAAEGSSRPSSQAGYVIDTPDGLYPTRRPSISRENSASRLPVYKRDASMPQINRDRDKITPNIRRERSEIRSKTFMSPMPHCGSNTSFLTETTPKTAAQQKIAERNVAAKGTRSGVSGISDLIMIGDKVRITASNKIGMVQFVGETKFAKGVWAGIVLEDASGKNDGSVAGIRYFSCPSLHGVFVKEDKLEKIKNIKTSSTPKSASKTILNRSGVKTPLNRNGSAMSIDSSVEEMEQDLNIGDKVYITSINNIRTGILRYIGLTEFAKGTWCGIELEEPLGKNDGAVAGKRYFQCMPKFGIFSQVQKVKKCHPSFLDETQKTPSPAAAEEAAPITTTPVANGAVDSVKSEEEMTLNALEAVLQNESDSSLEPSSPVISEDPTSHKKVLMQTQVSQLEKEKSDLKSELYESKQKIENLQFQLEEQLMICEDLEPSEQDAQKLKELESKLFTKEEESMRLQTEIEDLKKEHENNLFQLTEKDMQLQSKDETIAKYEELIDISKKSESSMMVEVNGLKQQIESFHEHELNVDSTEDKSEEVKDHYENQLSEKESTIFSLEEKLMDLESKFSTLSGELEEKASVIKDLESHVEKKSFEMEEYNMNEEALNKSINELNGQIAAKQSEITSLMSSNEAFQQEKVDLAEQLNTKLAELSSLLSTNEVLKKENLDFKASLEVLESRNQQLAESNTKLEEDILVTSKNSGDSAEQTTYLNEQIQVKNREINTLKDHQCRLIAENNKLESQMEDYKEKAKKDILNLENEKNMHIRKLEDSCHQSEDSAKAMKLANEEYARTIEKLENELQMSSKEISLLREATTRLENVKEELKSLSNTHKVTLETKESEINLKNSELGILRDENNQLRTRNESLSEKYSNITNELNIVREEKISLEKLVSTMNIEKDELIKAKDKVSRELENLAGSSTKYCAEINSLESVNNSLEKEKNNLESKNTLLTEELQSLIASVDFQKEDRDKIRKEAMESSLLIEKLRADLLTMGLEADSTKSLLVTVEEEKAALNIKCMETEKQIKFLEGELHMKNKRDSDASEENIKLQDELKNLIEKETSARISKEIECSNLQMQVKECLSKITLLENNNSLFQFEVDELHQKNALLLANQNKKHSKKSAGGEYEQLREEIESFKVANSEKESQLNFLNSIIVDLQKKNKEQKEKIDILSYGDDVKELDNTISPIKPGLPLRKFCDICDIFDLHDTEDCPQQSNDFGGVQHHGKRGEERPFCEVCETFGHTADTCDDEETF